MFKTHVFKKLLLIFVLGFIPVKAAIQTPLKLAHITSDFIDCNIPQDATVIETVMREAARQCGAIPLGFTLHEIEPDAFSAVVILDKSQIVVHFWFLEKYAEVDIITCGENDPMLALWYLEDKFKPKLVIYNTGPKPFIR